MTDDELREWSRTRLEYDVEMLLYAGHALSTLPAVRPRAEMTTRDMVHKNALLDSFAVHVRALTAFLFDDDRARATDVIAADFMTDVAAWRQARRVLPPTLAEARKRSSKEVAHLTETALGGGPSAKPWHPAEIVAELKPVIQLFTEHAAATRLDSLVTGLLRFHEQTPIGAVFDMKGKDFEQAVMDGVSNQTGATGCASGMAATGPRDSARAQLIDEKRVEEAARALDAEEREAERQIAQSETAALQFTQRLLAAIRVMLQEHGPRIPESVCGVVANSLYSKIYGNARAVYRLCRLGHSLDAPIVTRSAVETLITLRFITIAKDRCHERAELWAKYSEVLKWKVSENNPNLLRNEEERRRLRERYEAVKTLFPKKARCWAAKLGAANLYEMAKEVHLEWHYHAVYWMGSQPTHASSIGVDDYLDIDEDKRPMYRAGLSGRHVKAELAAVADALIRGVMFLNEAFDLGLKPGTDALILEYREAMGVDPLISEFEA